MKIILRKKSENKEPFSFSFVSNDKTIVKSETYTVKANAIKGIESVKKNCLDDNRYELKEAKNGSTYFNIKSTNGQIVGTSPMFKTEDDRANAISSLKEKAASAPIEEA
jgi:uncharacterized protein YegP (UPF0339 family)